MKQDYPLIGVDQFVQSLGSMPNGGLILLIGLPGAGKSDLAAQMAQLGFEHINGDNIRQELFGDANNHSDSAKVYSTTRSRLEQALAQQKRIVLDLMNVTRKHRRSWLQQARNHGYQEIHLVLLDTPLNICLKRNSQRSRVVAESIIKDMYNSMIQSGAPAEDEGLLHVLQGGPDSAHFYLVSPDHYRQRRPLSCKQAAAVVKTAEKRLLVRRDEAASKLDVIGDVHGCYEELLELLTELGYRFNLDLQSDGSFRDFRFVPPESGRKLAFVGDFADRGLYSEKVFALAMELYSNGSAVAVCGNHDDKLSRYLRGNPVKVGVNLATTIVQIEAYGQAFIDRLGCFLDSLPLIYETKDLIMVHGAYRENASYDQAESLCLLGETDGTSDENGFPHRLTFWEQEYSGDKFVVRGHDVVHKPRFVLKGSGKAIANVDTGCVFGGRLTALRFPELKLFSVPAHQAYKKWIA